MKIKKFSLNNFINDNALPVILLTVLFGSVIYNYALNDYFVFTGVTLFAFVYSLLLFAVLDFLKRIGKTWLSTIVMIVFSFFSLIAGSSMIETNYADTGQWFFAPDDFSQIYVGNIISVILLFGFVLGSALYYFTQVRFRAFYVFLICLCPFSLFAKSFTDIPVIFTILIITLFFVLVISKETTGKIFCGKNRHAAVIAFIVVVSLNAAFFPKLENAPYREQFDEAITGINIAAPAGIDFNDFSESSSSTKSDDEDAILFTFYGDNPLLIKRQCFNAYNKKDAVWEYYGDVSTGKNYYNSYIDWENPALLAAACGIDLQTDEKLTIVRSESGKLKALYTSENVTSFEFMYSSLSDYAEKNVYRTPLDEYFMVEGNIQKFNNYTLKWCDFDIDVEFMLLFDDEKAGELNNKYVDNYLLTKEQMKAFFDPLMTDEVRRECYKNDKTYEQVKALVKEITVGCSNDYEKAVAIEQYFKTSEFVYDSEFYVSDASVENFLFNTKRGICTDYATAMTLMCREAGLYARYVEGFLIQDSYGDGGYSVSSSDGHAYVQVWLDGYGWTDFDPTSTNTDDGYVDPTFFIVGSVMILIAVIGVVFFIVRPVLLERLFVKRAKRLKGRGQLLMLYPRINSIVHKDAMLKPDIMTVQEIKEIVKSRYLIDISGIADDFECTAYGDVDCGDKNYIDYYLQLKNAIKLKKSEERKAHRKTRKK